MLYEDRLVEVYKDNQPSRKIEDLPYLKPFTEDEEKIVSQTITSTKDFHKIVKRVIKNSPFLKRPDKVDHYYALVNMYYDYSSTHEWELPYWKVEELCGDNRKKMSEIFEIITSGENPLCRYYKNSTNSRKPNRIEWNFDLIGTRTTEVPMDKEARNIAKHIVNKNKEKMLKSELLTQTYMNWDSDLLYKPTDKEYRSFLFHNPQLLAIDETIDMEAKAYENALENTRYCFRTITQDRMFYGYSNSPKTARMLMRYNGEELVDLDFKACHLVIILKEFIKAYPDSNDVKILSNILNSNDPRLELFRFLQTLGYTGKEESFKKSILSWLNMTTDDMGNVNFHPIMYSSFPDFMKFIWNIKHSNYGMKNYKNMSRLLTHKEAEMMDIVFKRVQDKGIFCLPIHDGIDCAKSNAIEVERIFKEVIVEFGYDSRLVKRK